MNDNFDDVDVLESLSCSDEDFDAEISTLIQEGLADGDIGYRHWWNIAHNLKLAKMELVFCREARKYAQENPNCLNEVYSVLEIWRRNPQKIKHAELWMSLLDAEDWDAILAMTSEGLRLREFSPMRFSLPDAVCFEITRLYWR